MGLALCLSAGLPAHAEEPLPLVAVIERAVSYDPQVRAAQAELEALRRRPADPAGQDDPRARRNPAARGRADAGPAEPTLAAPDAVAIDGAERALRRAREQAAARTAAAALELQRQDRLVALARQRLADAEQLVRTLAEPRPGARASAASRRDAESVSRAAQGALRAAEAALGDARAARLAALTALESQAGTLVQGVAAVEVLPTPTPDPLGDEEQARQRAEQVAARLREARAAAASPRPPEVGQVLQLRDAVHGLEVQAVDAAHALALARVGTQVRQGTWRQALADARPAVEAAAVAPVADAATAVDPALAAALSRWLDAWRSKDLARYLASYAADFVPTGMNQAQWRAQRRSRLAQPGRFDIEIDAPAWERADGGAVEVRFTQNYRSPSYADLTEKRLVWRMGPDGWRIVRELAEPARRVASSR